jgi:RimJ/RimL family protein N-acetyltransferase
MDQVTLSRHTVERGDIEHIAHHLRDRDKREIFALRWDDDVDRFIGDIELNAHALWNAWRWDGEPIALNGVVIVRPGVVIAGAFGTDKWHYAVRGIINHAWEFTIPALQASGYHRGEAYVMAVNTDSRLFIEALGAEKEAYLHQYGRNCEDFVLYRWRLNDVLQRGRRRRTTIRVLQHQRNSDLPE